MTSWSNGGTMKGLKKLDLDRSQVASKSHAEQELIQESHCVWEAASGDLDFRL